MCIVCVLCNTIYLWLIFNGAAGWLLLQGRAWWATIMQDILSIFKHQSVRMIHCACLFSDSAKAESDCNEWADEKALLSVHLKPSLSQTPRRFGAVYLLQSWWWWCTAHTHICSSILNKMLECFIDSSQSNQAVFFCLLHPSLKNGLALLALQYSNVEKLLQRDASLQNINCRKTRFGFDTQLT